MWDQFSILRRINSLYIFEGTALRRRESSGCQQDFRLLLWKSSASDHPVDLEVSMLLLSPFVVQYMDVEVTS